VEKLDHAYSLYLAFVPESFIIHLKFQLYIRNSFFLNFILIYISVAHAVQTVPMKLSFEVRNYMVSGDDSVRKGTQLSVTEESYINK